MLKRLVVKNVAIIEDLDIEFDPNMTVISGETGAGKSLIIDSISLLLGSRADQSFIRYGKESLSVLGVFDYKDENINQILEQNGIKVLDDITIYREINLKSKNIIKINGDVVSMVLLKTISSYLADIHVQHDTFRLINKDTYLSFIDDMSNKNFLKLYNDYMIKYFKYNDLLKEIKEISLNNKLSKEKLEYLMYEKKEIDALNLYQNKDIELEEKINKLSNYDKIYQSLNEAYQNMENEYFSLDNIYNSYKALDDIANYDKEYLKNKDVVYDAYSNLLDVKTNLYNMISGLDFDPQELDLLQEELHEIEACKTKYKKSLDELIEEVKKINDLIALNENYDDFIASKEKELKKSYDTLFDAGLKIREYRMKEASKIEKEIENECRDLELKECRFNIVFNEVFKSDIKDGSIFLENGIDEVNFMISLNKGEPLKPLEKTASGGELSRIMLAFKAYFAKKSNLSLMIFDEIDSGVSGDAARMIALKMKNIASYHQVISITHLPAVAAISDNQILISKNVVDGRTYTSYKKLNEDERVEEIAKMIGGTTLTKSFIDVAREMLKNKKEL